MGFFLFEMIINALVISALFEYLCYRSTAIICFNSFGGGGGGGVISITHINPFGNLWLPVPRMILYRGVKQPKFAPYTKRVKHI